MRLRVRRLHVASVLIAATAGAVWAARHQAASSAAPPLLRDLERAVARAPTRTVRARVCCGFRHVRPPAGGEDVDPDVRIAAASLEAGAGSADPRWRGVARLFAGRAADAVADLQAAADGAPDDASLQNDLAAAYLERAARTGRPADVVRALAHAERSLAARPDAGEALFNRALALEALHLRPEAARAWSAVAERGEPGWSSEARDREQASGTPLPADPDFATIRRRLAAGPNATAALVDARQRAREWIEDELLPAWAEAVLRGDAAAGSTRLAEAATVSQALAAAGGDTMPAAGVAAVEGASADLLPVLARAHLRFAEARRLLAEVRLEPAAAAATDAARGFARGGSPYAWWAPVYQAIADRMAGRVGQALAGLAGVERRGVPEGFRHWRGRVHWTRGVSHGSAGRLDRARGEFLEAVRLFGDCGEGGHESLMRTMLAETMGELGDHPGSWDEQVRALAWLSGASGRRADLVLHNAALLARSQDLPEAALPFLDAVVSAALRANDAPRLGEAYLQRASTLATLRRWADADADRRRAADTAASLPPGGFKDRLRAEIAASAAGAHEASPVSAEAAATEAIVYFQAAGHPVRVVELLIDRARARDRSGRVDEAEADLEHAIGEFGKQRARLQSHDDQAAAFEGGRAASTEMVRLQVVRRARPDLALRHAERARAWPPGAPRLRDAGAPSDPVDGVTALPTDTALLFYVVLDDRLLAWVLRSTGTTHFAQPGGAGALGRHVAALRTLVVGDGGRQEIASASAPLWAALLAPAAPLLTGVTRLVVLADGPLHGLPFAALMQPSGRYLVEDFAIELAPSLSVALRRVPDAPVESVLAMGDGHVPSDALPRLPHADAEATAVAALYPTGRALLGSEATRRRFLELAPRASVVHFAGHAVTHPDDPRFSHLLAAPDPQDDDPDGVLFARDLGARSFEATRVVVLAACATAAGRAVAGEGPLNLVRPFLAGGATHVVANLWDVADQASGPLFLDFHRELRRGSACSRALRAAQLQAIRSGNPIAARPSAWGGYITYGGGQTGRPPTITKEP